MKVLTLLFFALFARIDARLFEGQCRTSPAPVISPFNYNLYLGEWYEIEWYDDEYATFDECIKFSYTASSSNTFSMTLDLKDSSKNFSPSQYSGTGVASTLGSLSTQGTLSTAFNPGHPARVNHQILATDNENYAFVWDCVNVNQTHYNEKMWYFDRKPIPSERPKKVDELIKHFDQQYIRKTYQGDDCGWTL